MGVVLDEESMGVFLLLLLSQVQKTPAERGQGTGEVHRGEELKQVWPEYLRTALWSVSQEGNGGCSNPAVFLAAIGT